MKLGYKCLISPKITLEIELELFLFLVRVSCYFLKAIDDGLYKFQFKYKCIFTKMKEKNEKSSWNKISYGSLLLTPENTFFNCRNYTGRSECSNQNYFIKNYVHFLKDNDIYINFVYQNDSNHI